MDITHEKTHLEFIHENDRQMLIDRYNEKHRYYHNLDHVMNMLNHVDIANYKHGRNIMMIAIWFHDAIYDPTQKDNEEKSIELFIESATFADMKVEDRNIVVDMINATKDHAKASNSEDLLPQVFVDFLEADLFELLDPNLPISRTVEIEMAVFKEYGFVPFNIYKKERIKILENLKESLSLEVDDNINFLKFFKPKIGLYCGSFNPIHKGHYRIIERGAEIFDKVIVARGINPLKPVDMNHNKYVKL